MGMTTASTVARFALTLGLMNWVVIGGACPAAGDDDPAEIPAPRAPFSVRVLDDARISSRGDAPNFQNVRGVVDFGPGPFAKVTLRAQLKTTCFPFSAWEEPPPGENWPASCDAFDRNFEISLEPEASASEPAIEVVRSITPFGGPQTLELDITDLANARPGLQTILVHITTFSDGAGIVSGSDGGWNIDVDVDIEDGDAPRTVLAVVPIMNGNITVGASEQIFPFRLPEGTSASRLEVRTTGHGGPNTDDGCIGPAEEFCRRQHAYRVDAIDLGTFEPYLESCEENCTLAHEGPANGGFDYCLENPTGNIGSVRAPRANWCPGAVTPPFVYDDVLDGLGGGPHELSMIVSRVAEGGIWRSSAVIYAYGD